MRQKIWKYLIKKYHKNIGDVLPRWLIIIRIILFPINFFYYYYNKHNLYDVYRDIWNINGFKFSNEFFVDIYKMTADVPHVFELTKENNNVIFKKIS